MLRFATEFPIRDTTPAAFIAAVREWIQGSPHTKIRPDQIDAMPSEGHWSVSNEAERLEVLIAKNAERTTAGFRHTAIGGNLEWRTIAVYSAFDDAQWVSITTHCEALQAQVTLPPAKKPLLVKVILSKLGGGLDGECFVSDQPFLLKENDVGMASRLLNSDSDNYLPVVYISRDFQGKIQIKPEPLSRALGGLAHILVEPDREFSRLLQVNVGSRNVYGGHIGLYWPNGERYVFSVNPETRSEFDVRRAIEERVRTALINRRPLARCTWSRAEAEAASQAFSDLRASGSKDVSEYVSAFDAEISAKEKQLDEAEIEISRLKAHIRNLEMSVSRQADSVFSSDIQEFFPGELASVLRDALLFAVDNCQNGGRRQHVISSYVASIPKNEILRNKKTELKEILSKYRSMTPEVRLALEKLGFSVFDDSKHYKLVYMSDDKYTFPLPKTGSDWRGGKNSVSDIGKRIF